MQRHLREHLSKIKNYNDLEGELYAELYRREADGDKPGSLNQLGGSEDKNDDEKEKVEEWPEQVWQDVWSPEFGWVQALQALETKRPREGDDETPQDSKVPRNSKGKCKAKGKGVKKGVCWQCGADDHYQADCPKHWKVRKGIKKGTSPIPAAWSSWRPSA